MAIDLPPEARDFAAALGIVGPDGAVDGPWFKDPIARLRTMISNPAQRAALMAALDRLVPPDEGATDGDRRHPILVDDEGQGGVYLTTRTVGNEHVRIGF